MEDETNKVAPEAPAGGDISVSDTLSKGWALLSENLSTWAALALIIILPSVILTVALNSILDVEDIAANAENVGDVAGVLGGSLVVVLVVAIYQVIMYAILFSVYIKVAAGTKLEGVSQALSLGTPKAGKVILASIVVGVLVALGFVLLIIPGIIALFLLAATVYIVADTDLTIGQAISLSIEYAKQFFVQIFLLGLALFAISIVAGIIVGLFGDPQGIAYAAVSTTVNTAIQIFGGLSVAVLYLEMKKRYKKNVV